MNDLRGTTFWSQPLLHFQTEIRNMLLHGSAVCQLQYESGRKAADSLGRDRLKSQAEHKQTDQSLNPFVERPCLNIPDNCLSVLTLVALGTPVISHRKCKDEMLRMLQSLNLWNIRGSLSVKKLRNMNQTRKSKQRAKQTNGKQLRSSLASVARIADWIHIRGIQREYDDEKKAEQRWQINGIHEMRSSSPSSLIIDDENSEQAIWIKQDVPRLAAPWTMPDWWRIRRESTSEANETNWTWQHVFTRENAPSSVATISEDNSHGALSKTRSHKSCRRCSSQRKKDTYTKNVVLREESFYALTDMSKLSRIWGVSERVGSNHQIVSLLDKKYQIWRTIWWGKRRTQ